MLASKIPRARGPRRFETVCEGDITDEDEDRKASLAPLAMTTGCQSINASKRSTFDSIYAS